MPDEELSLDDLGVELTPETPPAEEHFEEGDEDAVETQAPPINAELDLEAAYKIVEKNRPDLLAAHQKQVVPTPDYEDDPNLSYEDQVVNRARTAMTLTMKMARDVREHFPELPEDAHKEVERVLQHPSLTLAHLQELDRTGGFIDQIGGMVYKMVRDGKIKMHNQQIPSKPANTPSPAAALKQKSRLATEEEQAMSKFAAMLNVPEKDLRENYQSRKAK